MELTQPLLADAHVPERILSSAFCSSASCVHACVRACVRACISCPCATHARTHTRTHTRSYTQAGLSRLKVHLRRHVGSHPHGRSESVPGEGALTGWGWAPLTSNRVSALGWGPLACTLAYRWIGALSLAPLCGADPSCDHTHTHTHTHDLGGGGKGATEGRLGLPPLCARPVPWSALGSSVWCVGGSCASVPLLLACPQSCAPSLEPDPLRSAACARSNAPGQMRLVNVPASPGGVDWHRFSVHRQGGRGEGRLLTARGV